MKRNEIVEIINKIVIVAEKKGTNKISLEDLSFNLFGEKDKYHSISYMLLFLEFIGIIVFDTEKKTFSFSGKHAIKALSSISRSLQNNLQLVNEWTRLGVSDSFLKDSHIMDRGIDFLYWLESQRIKYDPTPINHGIIGRVIIKGKSINDEDLFLLQRSHKSGQYQFIGGRRRNSETSEELIIREMREELRGNDFNFGVNVFIEKAATFPITILSPTFGCQTTWDGDVYYVTMKNLKLYIPENCRWASHRELNVLKFDDGEKIVLYDKSKKDEILELLKRAPYSIKEHINWKKHEKTILPAQLNYYGLEAIVKSDKKLKFIIGCDIVKSSMNIATKIYRMYIQLTGIISNALKDNEISPTEAFAQSTGDGYFIFLDSSIDVCRIFKIINSIFFNIDSENYFLPLRFGVNFGEVFETTIQNGRKSAIGSPIAVCERVMSFGDERHILINLLLYESYIKKSDIGNNFIEIGKGIDKQGEEHHLYSYQKDSFGNSEIPGKLRN